MNAQQVRDLLRKRCNEAGGQRSWAGCHCVSESYVSDVIRGAREPGPGVLKGLGLVAVTVYQDEWLDREGDCDG